MKALGTLAVADRDILARTTAPPHTRSNRARSGDYASAASVPRPFSPPGTAPQLRLHRPAQHRDGLTPPQPTALLAPAALRCSSLARCRLAHESAHGSRLLTGRPSPFASRRSHRSRLAPLPVRIEAFPPVRPRTRSLSRIFSFTVFAHGSLCSPFASGCSLRSHFAPLDFRALAHSVREDVASGSRPFSPPGHSTAPQRPRTGPAPPAPRRPHTSPASCGARLAPCGRSPVLLVPRTVSSRA